MWEYRVLDQISDLNEVVDLEIAVWKLDARDAVPSSILHAMVNVGSLLLGAYHRNRLVGMALAFPGMRSSKKILWSHMAAVHPDYQGQGVGFSLKQFQRIWALDHKYTAIGWTFDPLQSGNANFNLHRLGAISNTYHVDFYGEMTDGINAGLPSDRLEVVWRLNDRRVKNLASNGQFSGANRADIEPVFLLRVRDGKQPHIDLSLLGLLSSCCVEIPSSLSSLKRFHSNLLHTWRLALRETLQAAFGRGFTLVDFVFSGGGDRCWYILSATPPWFLYILECSDNTLYTGVSPDIRRRLAMHNAGRGAAYTAVRRPVSVLAAWCFSNQSAALKAESAFKKLSREVKLRLIGQRQSYQNAPFWKDGVF
jgi:predicted GNAT superfamily acetyltransferase